MALKIEPPKRCPFCGGKQINLIVMDEEYTLAQCIECDWEWLPEKPDNVEEIIDTVTDAMHLVSTRDRDDRLEHEIYYWGEGVRFWYSALHDVEATKKLIRAGLQLLAEVDERWSAALEAVGS